MRANVWSIVVCCLCCARAAAQERFVERTPLPRTPVAHTMERAGHPTSVSQHAVPSVTPRTTGGYIGGGALFHNNIFAKGSGAVSGPVADGTFGTDYTGLRVRPGRVFLGESRDPTAGPSAAHGYRTDGPHVPDVFASRPFRKALFEKKDARRE